MSKTKWKLAQFHGYNDASVAKNTAINEIYYVFNDMTNTTRRCFFLAEMRNIQWRDKARNQKQISATEIQTTLLSRTIHVHRSRAELSSVFLSDGVYCTWKICLYETEREARKILHMLDRAARWAWVSQALYNMYRSTVSIGLSRRRKPPSRIIFCKPKNRRKF